MCETCYSVFRDTFPLSKGEGSLFLCHTLILRWHYGIIRKELLYGGEKGRAEKEAVPLLETKFCVQRRFVPLEETEVQDKAVAETGTEAATRTADVLLLFLHGPAALGVSEIARQLELSKTVVFRILRSLRSRGLLVLDASSHKYRLGPAAAALGAHALRDLDLRQLALPRLRQLQQETGETAVLSALVGASLVYLEQVVSVQAIKMTVEVGRLSPLHAGASGKAMLAFAPPDVRQQVLSGPLAAVTPQTTVSSEILKAELEQIRRAGVAVTFGERQVGAGSVAAPVLGVDGYALGAICVCGPADRFGPQEVERFIALVQPAAQTISRHLGWDGTFPARRQTRSLRASN
jgi:IclR family transcriptional regulator, acetate operon repressor